MSSSGISRRLLRWRPWRLIFVALLALPPTVRWLSPSLQPLPGELTREAALEATVLALRVELETTRFEAERLRALEQSWGQVELSDRHERLLADVLPVSDPSPRRRILWAHTPGARRISRPAAVICTLEVAASEPQLEKKTSALVGRALAPTPHLPLARVETTLDPAFRVRFRHHGASGMLWGTGEESAGRPVLEIKHLSELIELKDGEAVVTEGRDGVYPEGILIGFVVREDAPEPDASGAAPPGRLFVRGAAAPEALRQVIVVIDRAQESLAHLRLLEEETSP